MLLNFYTKMKTEEALHNLSNPKFKKKNSFGITAQVENSKSSKCSSLAGQDFNLHFKNYRDKSTVKFKS